MEQAFAYDLQSTRGLGPAIEREYDAEKWNEKQNRLRYTFTWRLNSARSGFDICIKNKIKGS